jgi:hypothetical protein
MNAIIKLGPLLLWIFLEGCNKPSGMYEFSKALYSQNNIKIYKMEQNQLPKNSSGNLYERYVILDSAILKEKDFESFKKQALNTSNYLKNLSRNCPSIPTYGFQLTKGSVKYIVTLSSLPCAKLIVVNNNTKEEKVFDLAEKNTMSPYVETLFK